MFLLLIFGRVAVCLPVLLSRLFEFACKSWFLKTCGRIRAFDALVLRCTSMAWFFVLEGCSVKGFILKLLLS